MMDFGLVVIAEDVEPVGTDPEDRMSLRGADEPRPGSHCA
jgi:hypothetical protein